MVHQRETPGSVELGGLVYSSNKLIKTSFSWGLGFKLNNQAKSYALFKACQIAKEFGFKSIQIFDDSELLIKTLNSAHQFYNPVLNNILQRVRHLFKDFGRFQSFHILLELNNSGDEMENKACLLAQGHLSMNGKSSCYHAIP